MGKKGREGKKGESGGGREWGRPTLCSAGPQGRPRRTCPGAEADPADVAAARQ